MAVAEIPVTGHLLGTGSQEIRNMRLWQLTALPGSPNEGIFWYDSDGGDKRIHFYDGSGEVIVPRLDRAESVVGQWGFNPGSVQAPFTLNANAQGQVVTGLNADLLDGWHGDQAVTANTVAVRYTSGRLRVADPVGTTDAVNYQSMAAAIGAITIDASQITTGLLALARGGTNKDLSGAATGALIWKDADSFEATGALTGVLIGNGTSAPSALSQLTVALGGTGASTVSGARTNLDVLWSDDSRRLAVARRALGGVHFVGSAGYAVAGTSGLSLGLSDFTVSFIIRMSDYTPSTTGFLTSHSGGNNRVLVQVDATGQFILRFIDSGGTPTDAYFPPDVALVDGATYHVVLTADRDGLATLYVNGISDRDKNASAVTASIAAASAVNVGSGNAAAFALMDTFTGSVHSFTVYNSLLSAAEVLALVENGRVDFSHTWGTTTAIYTSNFTAGADSWTGNSGATVTGNIDAIGAENDTLRIEGTTGTANASRAVTNRLKGQYVKLSYRVYIPSSNVTGVNIRVNNSANNSTGFNSFTPALDTWTTCSETVILTAELGSSIRFALRTAGSSNTVTNGDKFYIKDVTLEYLGAILDLDFEEADPTKTTAVKDRTSNNNHATATSGLLQTAPKRQLNTETLLASSLTANNVVYAGAGGLLTGLAVNSGAIRVLTQASSAAPVWTDLFGGTNTWTGATVFSSTVSVSGLTTNAVIYGGASGLLTSLGLNTTGTVKFLTQVSSGAPVWTDLYATNITWSGNHTFNGTVTVITPTTDYHAATKAYVDGAVSSGLRVLAECRVATTANITLSGEQTIDGVLTSASSVLVKNQTAPAENGIYTSAAGAWTRRTDCDVAAEITKGAYTFVSAGTANAGTSWTQTLTVTTIGTDPVTWVKFFQQAAYVAGSGISISGLTISVDVSFSPTWGGTHTFSNAPRISTLTTNQVLYAGGSGAVTGLGLNAGSIRFLTQTSSGAPVWTDLYAATGVWTGFQTFSNASGFLLNPHGASAGNTTELRFAELAANGTSWIGFKAPDALAAAVTFTLPNADGAANSYLKTNGSGALSFTQIQSSEISNALFVTAVNGTTNRITSTGGLNPTIDISASYVGQTSITTLGTIATAVWQGTTIAAPYGGTGIASYTTGDLLFASSSSALSKLGVATLGKFLSTTGTLPAWSAYALPTSVAANQLLYGSSGTAVSALSTSASKILTTDGSGNLGWSSTLPAGLSVAGDTSAGTASKPVKMTWFDVGDGSSTTVTLTHNYATTDVAVLVHEISSGRTIIVAVTRPTNNTVALEFATAPSSAQYRAAVISGI